MKNKLTKQILIRVLQDGGSRDHNSLPPIILTDTNSQQMHYVSQQSVLPMNKMHN